MKRETSTRLTTLGSVALLLSLSLVAAATGASAQQSEKRMLPEEMPGYVDFESFGSFDLDDLTRVPPLPKSSPGSSPSDERSPTGHGPFGSERLA